MWKNEISTFAMAFLIDMLEDNKRQSILIKLLRRGQL